MSNNSGSTFWKIVGGLSLLLFAFLLLRPWGVAQEAPEPEGGSSDTVLFDPDRCLDHVVEAYGSLSHPPGGDSILQMTLSTDVVGYQGGDLPELSTSALVQIGRDRVRVVGDRFLLDRDSEQTLFIESEHRTARLNSAFVSAGSSYDPAEFIAEQKKLLERCRVTECESINRSGVPAIRVHLSPNPDHQRAYNVREAIVTVASDGSRVFSVEVRPLQGGHFDLVRWEFRDVQVRILPDEFTKEIDRQIFESDGRTRSEYESYTVVDERVGE